MSGNIDPINKEHYFKRIDKYTKLQILKLQLTERKKIKQKQYNSIL